MTGLVTDRSRILAGYPRRLLYPPRGQHFAAAWSCQVNMASQEISSSGERLLERPFLLQRFAQDDKKHQAMAGIGHRFNLRPPAVHEGLRVTRVFLNDRAHVFG